MLARMHDRRIDRAKLAMAAGCSDMLIGIVIGGGVIHPTFADRIADILGCSEAQRDSMVHEIHRGKWIPGASLKKRKKIEPAPAEPAQPRPCNVEKCKEVVVLNEEGAEVRRYASATETAAALGCSDTYVRNRTKRRITPDVNEFRPFGYTYRYAQEWDRLTDKEKRAEILAARGSKK